MSRPPARSRCSCAGTAFEKILVAFVQNLLPWGDVSGISIALELATSRFVGTLETHSMILYLADRNRRSPLLAMSRNWKQFWLTPKYERLVPRDNPFVFDWYIFCKSIGGHLPHLLQSLNRIDDVNAKACLARCIRQIPPRNRDPYDRIMLRYADGKKSMLETIFAIVRLTDPDDRPFKVAFQEFKAKLAKDERSKDQRRNRSTSEA
jgi:hypothetical protein